MAKLGPEPSLYTLRVQMRGAIGPQMQQLSARVSQKVLQGTPQLLASAPKAKVFPKPS